MANIPVFGLGGQIEQQRIIDASDTEALLVRKDADGGDVFVVDTSNARIMTGDGTLALPGWAWVSDPNTGFYKDGAVSGQMFYSSDGSRTAQFSSTVIIAGSGSTKPALLNEAISVTNPTVIGDAGDTDTGMGGTTDTISLIAGGVEGLRLTENVGVLLTQQVNAGLTADSGSAQGGTPLTSSVNEVSTVATIGDSVTLPTAVAGHVVTIINTAANACDVFPASGDDLGAGVDTAASLAGGANITYRAYDDTNWFAVT